MTNTTAINNTNITTENTDTLSVFEKILLIRYFLPAITTISFLIGMAVPLNSFFEGILLLLMGLGILSALTVCPIKLILFPVKCAFAGFKFFRGFVPFFGYADLVAGILGLICGFVFGVMVVFILPAAFTIKKFFSDAEEFDD